MTTAVVFALAVADGLPPVIGAAPYDVLARQLPRMLVASLNGGSDRGVRFFPFLGNDSGRRTFLQLRDCLAPETLGSLHRLGEVGCLVDGRIHGDGLRLRIVDGSTLRPRFEADLPFDPRRPLESLVRAQFEVMGALGWGGRPGSGTTLSGEALAWLLIAKDELLALEANLLPGGGDPLRAIHACCAAAPGDEQVQAVAIDLCAQLLRHAGDRQPIARLLGELVPHLVDDGLRLRTAELLLAGDAAGAAATLYAQVALAAPGATAVVDKAAALLFRQRRLQEARTVLRAAHAAGAAGEAAVAQLLAIEDQLGDHAAGDALIEHLLHAGVTAPAVARVLAGFLLARTRATEALRVIDTVLVRHQQVGGLWLDRGRALLLLDRSDEARADLQRARQRGLVGDEQRDAQRLLRLCEVPGILSVMQAIEQAVRSGDRQGALRAARRMVRAAPASAETWLLLGTVRHRLQQLRRAERALRHALELQPGLAETHNRLGILLVARGQLQQGHDQLAAAMDLAPHDPAPRLHQAQACALLGRRAEGLQHLEAAARLGADPELLAAVRREFFAKEP
ncbi:MAG TPA: hypothetical protein VK348_14485 [Planctomycetota bacterium]|nr:hypothetical protein [Planctomycetota bacterium]